MRRRRRRAGPAAVLVLLAGACSGGDPAAPELGEVTSAEVVETVAAPATIEPARRVTVTAPAGGTVETLRVADGDRVRRGDPLVRLSSQSVDDRIDQAEAAVRAAGSLSQIPGGVDLSPLFDTVGDQLDAVLPELLTTLSAQAEQLEDDPRRRRALDRIEQARAAYEDARSSLARAEREAAAGAAEATAGQREAAAAQRRQAEVALEAAQRQAEELLVTAPAAGVVELARGAGSSGPGAGTLEGLAGDQLSQLGGPGSGALGGLQADGTEATGPVREGTEVGAGEALMTVFDLSGFHAEATVDEIDAVDVAAGQAATVLVDAHPDLQLDGRVRHVALAPDPGATGGVIYPTVVSLAGIPEDVRLLPGLTASVEIVVDRVSSDTVVPSAALRRRDGGDVVWVDRDGRATVVPVDVVALGADTAAVTGDLETGERVVVGGVEQLRPGDEIE